MKTYLEHLTETAFNRHSAAFDDMAKAQNVEREAFDVLQAVRHKKDLKWRPLDKRIQKGHLYALRTSMKPECEGEIAAGVFTKEGLTLRLGTINQWGIRYIAYLGKT